MKPGKRVTPKMFKPDVPVSQYFFAQIANVSQTAVSKAVDKHRIIINEDGQVPCDNLKNSLFLIKHLTKSLNSGTDEEKRYRQAVLRVLTTHTKVDIDTPEPREYDYNKLAHEQTYAIGIIQNTEFIPVVYLTKFEERQDEIQIKPLDIEISLGLKKGKLTDLFFGEENAGDLYYLPVE